MPSPQTPKAAAKVRVAPGEGRKVPLRIPGTSIMVPADGRPVPRSIAVQRLLATGDLVDLDAVATAPPSPAPTNAGSAAVATPKSDVREG